MKEKILFIGYINRDVSNGPSVVLYNIIEECKKSKIKYKFINTCCNSVIEKIRLLIKIFLIILYKDFVINVHSYGYKIPYYILLISKINKRNNYFFTLHGILSEEVRYVEINDSSSYKGYFKNKEKFDYMENRIIKEFPNIICVSNSQRNIIDAKFNRRQNTHVIYNGVNLNNKFEVKKIENNKIKLIMAGGIYNLKNIFLVIELIIKYNKINNSKIYLKIYGGYESEELLKKYYKTIEENKLNNYIEYKGKIKKAHLLNEYKKADFCIAISKYDTFNLTALEAMSVGTPVIISDKCGISEVIIDGVNGCIYNLENDNLTKISYKIKKIVENNELYNRICLNAYNESKKFSWNIITDKYVDLLLNRD